MPRRQLPPQLWHHPLPTSQPTLKDRTREEAPTLVDPVDLVRRVIVPKVNAVHPDKRVTAPHAHPDKRVTVPHVHPELRVTVPHVVPETILPEREARTASASLDKPPLPVNPVPISPEIRQEDPALTVDTSADNPETRIPDLESVSSIVVPELAEERRLPREELERATGDP